jgi:hypothetical protein
MNLRIGLLCEAHIDEELIQPLLTELIGTKTKIFFSFPVPPNGFGEIPKNLKILINLQNERDEWEKIGCDLFIIIHDSIKTENIQREIKTILRGAIHFPAIYGLAIQEIEAWVLGDIENVNRHIFKITPCPSLPHPPESDPDPKATLNNIFIAKSNFFEYDRWNVEGAKRIAPFLRADQVKFKCKKGFGKLANDLRNLRLNGKKL